MGAQPAKMKQLMKRKLLNRQIVLSGWVPDSVLQGKVQ